MKMMEINQTPVSGVDTFKLQNKLNVPAASEDMEKLCFSDSEEDKNKKKTLFNNITSKNAFGNYSNGLVEGPELNGKTDLLGLDEISEDSLGDMTLRVNDDDDGVVDEMMEDDLLDEKYNLKKDLISNGNEKKLNGNKEKENGNKIHAEINSHLDDISSDSDDMLLNREIPSTSKDSIEKVSNDTNKHILNKSDSEVESKKSGETIENVENTNNVEKSIVCEDTEVTLSIKNKTLDNDKMSENNCDNIEKSSKLVNETEQKSDDIDKFLSAIDNAIECGDKKDSDSINCNISLDDIISLDDDDDEKSLNLESEKKEETLIPSTTVKQNTTEIKKTESSNINNNKDDVDDEEVVLLASPKCLEDEKSANKKKSIIDDDDDEEIVFIECGNISTDKSEKNKKGGDNDDLSDDDIIFFEDEGLLKKSEIDKNKSIKIEELECPEKKTLSEKSIAIVTDEKKEKTEYEITKLEEETFFKLGDGPEKKNNEDELGSKKSETEKIDDKIIAPEERKENDKSIEIVAKEETTTDLISELIESTDKVLDNTEEPIKDLPNLDKNNEKLDKNKLENNIEVSEIPMVEIPNNTEIDKDVTVDISISPIDNSTAGKSLAESEKNEEICEKIDDNVEKKDDNVEKIDYKLEKKIDNVEKMDVTEIELVTEKLPTTQKSVENLEINNDIIKNDTKISELCKLTTSEDLLTSNSSDNVEDICAENKIEEINNKSETVLDSTECKINQQVDSENEKDTDKIEEEKKLIENIEEPPQKKIKFTHEAATISKTLNSIDSEEKITEDISKKQSDDDDIVLIDEENTTLEKPNSDTKKTLKRTISQENLSNSSKKLKVDAAKANETFQYVSTKIESQISKISEQPQLYPAPKLPTNNSDIKLDFMKRFKRSINSMTKKDLEELVMQKIVESIIHTSEFGELRDIIEKQEQIIEQHRKKVTELTKQFKDLEMVHCRVLKDLETRNQQFIMPVKITRAVGLQVVIPTKIPNRPMPSTFSPGQGQTRDRDILTNQNLQRSQMSTNPNLNNSNTSPDSKRGRSHQKFTPLRPDTPQNSPLNRSNSSSSVGPSQGGPGGNASTPVLSTNLSQKINAQNLTQQQQHQLKMQQQQKQQQMQQVLAQKQLQQAQQQAALKRQALQQQNPNGMVHIAQNSITPSPSFVNQMAVRKLTGGHVRSPTNVVVKKSTTQIRASPQQDNKGTSIMAKQQQSSTPNSEPTKPTKSFIDLTDEDEQQLQQKLIGNSNAPQNQQLPALVAIPTNPQNSRISTYVVNNKANIAHQQQRTVANNRIQANRQQQPNLVTIQRQLPPSTTATRIAPPQQRQQQQQTVRYTHPAPLPRAPPLLSNPSWKEGPPRPAIHISNIETGIVISWTMDDLSERHADVTSYQIYAYQETAAAPQVDAWRHVGDVKAMLLPMAVTLTQFQEGQRYFFAVRAVDVHNRCGNFSPPKTWA